VYREVQDLFYDVTFFCRCMSDAFLSDEKEGTRGGPKGKASSILDSNPSVVDDIGGGEVIVLTSTRIPSSLKSKSHYSPPRKRYATVSAAESPDRFQQDHDDDEDDDDVSATGGGGGTPSSSPSSQSRRSSSTGGTFSYTNTASDDNDDNSTDAPSSRHTIPSTMYW
jgi:hypothetical protein